MLARGKLEAKDFREILHKLSATPIKARKTGLVAARCVARRETVETRWNGKELSDAADQGDWIVTNLSPERSVLRDRHGHTNTYVIRAKRFSQLYKAEGEANEFGAIFRAKERVQALYLSGGFDILAPWGEMQQAAEGYLLFNGAEVYGNSRETFEATYALDLE